MNQVPPPLLPGFRPGSSSFASGSPIKRAFAAVVGVILFAAAAAVGFMLFLALLAIGAIVATVFALRVWWWRRRFARQTGAPADSGSRPRPTTSQRGNVIDGEYRVVDRNPD